MIRLLLENNMDPNQCFRRVYFWYETDFGIHRNVLGSLYLCMATAQGKLDVVKLLLRNGATCGSDYNNDEIVPSVHDDDDDRKTTALMLSCLDKKYAGNNGHIEIFNLLLAQENNNYSIQNAFRNAVMCGYTEFVKSILLIPEYKHLMLLENDILHIAADNGFAHIVKILLDCGFPVTDVSKPQTILHTIIESKTQEHHDHGIGYAVVDKSNKIATARVILQWLARDGDRLTIETTDKYGEKGTPFFYAVLTCALELPPVENLETWKDNVMMIKLLVKHHADTDAKCINNFSALKYILKFPYEMILVSVKNILTTQLYKEMIEWLLTLGCSTDSIDAETLAGHTDDVKLLFRNHWNQLKFAFHNSGDRSRSLVEGQQGATLKCKPGKVYSGFCRRTNKHKSDQINLTTQSELPELGDKMEALIFSYLHLEIPEKEKSEEEKSEEEDPF
jgi:hypothetical protein